MAMFIRKLRKDYSKYREILGVIKQNSQKINFTLGDFLNWCPDTNFIVRFDGIMGVEFKIFGFNEKSLYDLDEEILSFDFDRISTIAKHEFYKFSLNDLLNMNVLKVRNSSSGAFVELLLDYESFLNEITNLFKESL